MKPDPTPSPVEFTPQQQLPRKDNAANDAVDTQPLNDIYFKPYHQYLAFLRENDLLDDLRSSVLYQVHEDLRLIRKWTKLRVVKASTRNYLAGCAAASYDSVFPGCALGDDVDRTQIVVPIPTSDYLSPRRLKAICKQCVHPEKKNKLRCVTVAIVDSESTTAYYRLFDQWEEIVHPQWKQKKVQGKTEEYVNGSGGGDKKVANDDSSGESSASDSD